MSIKPILFSGLILSIGLVACNKYPDGPAISLKSKKERIANTWKIEKALRNGNDVTSDYSIYTLYTSNDGDANLKATITFGSFTYQGDTDGTWAFNSNKKDKLTLDFENNEFDNVYQILRLKEDELWLREIGGEDELHLIPS